MPKSSSRYKNRTAPDRSVNRSKQKLFQCTGFGDCNMVFTRSEHLARHARKHTGEVRNAFILGNIFYNMLLTLPIALLRNRSSVLSMDVIVCSVASTI